MQKTERYCTIAVDCPLPPLTYRWGGEADQQLNPGQLVEVPLGKRKAYGCIVQVDCSPQNLEREKIKDFTAILAEHFSLDACQLKFFEWIAKYYHYPLGQLIFDCLPKLMKRPRVLNFDQGLGGELEHTLHPQQQCIVDKISPMIGKGFSRHLIHGVTGSGKTLIYLHLIRQVLARGQSVLFLLPEINLTPQFLQTFIAHLPAAIYSYNSTITDSDKYGLWKLLVDDDTPKVIIGVRSAIFLPLQKLGLLIVDEEHDQSFKQDDRCPYNARDLGLKKGDLLQIPVILGSATPSLETYYQFALKPRENTYYHTMTERAGKGKLPEIELVDMRHAGLSAEKVEQEKTYWPLTSNSIVQITQCLERQEQVLVFVNRLGFANYLQCRACGHQFYCPNCSTNLRFFKARNEVSCQYCDYKAQAPQICPQCQNMTLQQKGFGTERLQQLLQEHFPTKSIERFDRDEIKNMEQLEDRLNAFHRGEIDIMVGTQMLSKGHNFRRVNLVLVLGIDSQLNFPDFRASEKVYQMLTQVSGRSGRFGDQSKVMILTLGVGNQLFSYVKTHSFDQFYRDELSIRELCQCPPVSRLVMIYLVSRFQDKVIEEAVKAAEVFQQLKRQAFPVVEILGPKPALVEKRANKFSWNIMLRSSDVNQLHNSLHSFQAAFKPHYSVTIRIDVDPYTLV